MKTVSTTWWNCKLHYHLDILIFSLSLFALNFILTVSSHYVCVFLVDKCMGDIDSILE